MHIFYYTGGKFGEVTGVFFTRKTLMGCWTRQASDAGLASSVLLVSGVGGKWHRTVRWVSVGRGPNTIPASGEY